MNLFTRFLLIFTITLLLTQQGITREKTKKGWQSINIDSLEEWSDPGKWWKTQDGIIFADSKGGKKLPKIHYLFWKGSIKGDFELRLEYRIIANKPMDAGVNFRVEQRNKMNNNNLIGYQAELDTATLYSNKLFIKQGKLFGNIHDGKRNRMFKRNLHITINPDGTEKIKPLSKHFAPQQVFRKPPEWNSCRILVKGDHIKLYLNKVLANELIDHDIKMKSTGDAIALQFRPNSRYRFEVKNLKYKLLKK